MNYIFKAKKTKQPKKMTTIHFKVRTRESEKQVLWKTNEIHKTIGKQQKNCGNCGKTTK